jgi:uncharacterized MAPEG superfamily protein
MLDPHVYIGPLAVTLGYVLLYYVFQINVARVKFKLARDHAARGEKFDRYFGQDRHMLAADRSQLNMLEHMPPFLALLWLNAVFVSPSSATIAGGIYLASRVVYPLVMGARLGRGVRGLIALSTAPGYLVLVWFSGALLYVMFG